MKSVTYKGLSEILSVTYKGQTVTYKGLSEILSLSHNVYSNNLLFAGQRCVFCILRRRSELAEDEAKGQKMRKAWQ